MNTTSTRQQLHSYLEVADDRKIRAFYTLMRSDIEEYGIEFTNDLKSELETRYNSHKLGPAKMISATESKKRINKMLKRHKAK